MITTLAALLGSKYGKYALEIVIVGGLIFGAYKYAESNGRKAQKADDDGAQAVQIEKERREASAAKDKLLEHMQADVDAADARADIAQKKIDAQQVILNNLSAKSAAGHQQVAQLSDSELHGDVIRKLAVRQPGETPACYTPREERAIDDAVTQWPICQQEKGILVSQVKAVTDKVQAREDTIAAIQKGVDAQAAYVGLLESDYKKLWDAHPPRYRAGKCVWLWKCGRRKVDFSLPGKKG